MTRGVRNDGKPKSKGERWTAEEHELFLVGLRACGKGQWRRISHEFVLTRTPIQVASHAQKYFLKMERSNSPSLDKETATDTELREEARRVEELSLLACHFFYGFFMGFFNTYFYFFILHKLVFSVRPTPHASRGTDLVVA